MQIRAELASSNAMGQSLLQVRAAEISCRFLNLRFAVLYVCRLVGARMKLCICLTLQPPVLLFKHALQSSLGFIRLGSEGYYTLHEYCCSAKSVSQ